MGMKSSLILIPPLWESPQNYGDEFEDKLFSLKCSPKEMLLVGESGALAPLFASNQSKQNPTQSWAAIELVHIHATRDHLVLTDPNDLVISAEEESSLRASVEEILSELTQGLFIPTPNRWLFEADTWTSLKTFSPELAIGRNIDTWLPQDTNIPRIARKWRQIQNEIQMIWHDHPVNLERISRGELPVNSIWIYGIGTFQDILPHPFLKNIETIHGNLGIYKNVGDLFGLDVQEHPPTSFEKTKSYWIDSNTCPFKEDANAWENLWQAALKALHENEIDTIHLFQEHLFQNHLNGFIQLQKDDFSLPFLNKLFFSKKSQDTLYPSWNKFIQTSTKLKKAS